jgi:hypothetical protein
VLLALAAFESLIGLEEFSEAFDLHDAPLSFGQFVINARLAIHPFFAIARLVLAACRYFRAAIIVLAAYIVAAWLAELPTMARFGIEWYCSTLELSLLAQQVISRRSRWRQSCWPAWTGIYGWAHFSSRCRRQTCSWA